MAIIGTDITQASSFLKDGKLVAIPTETVYGLAANALDERAVLRIFEAKKRPFFDPLIVHVQSVEHAHEFADLSDQRLLKLAQRYWPGPLTLLLPRKGNIPGIVTNGMARVGIRVPLHQLTQQLLQTVGLPLAAPSANPFGYISPTLAAHVEKQLGDRVSYILDGGNCSIGIESTIVGVEQGVLCIYRLGGLAVESIEKIAGKAILKLNQNNDPDAPGQISNHYAPRKPLLFGDQRSLIADHEGKRIYLITFGGKGSELAGWTADLSSRGDLEEAALNLFRVLREADESAADVIIASPVPAQGLGLAINDRLSRASIR